MLKNLFNKLFLSKYIGSFVRHGMTTLGGIVSGWLLAKGIISGTEIIDVITNNLGEVIIAVILYLVGQGTSIVEKKK
jgi:glycopeptide antibiotics resistance protein